MLLDALRHNIGVVIRPKEVRCYQAPKFTFFEAIANLGLMRSRESVTIHVELEEDERRQDTSVSY